MACSREAETSAELLAWFVAVLPLYGVRHAAERADGRRRAAVRHRLAAAARHPPDGGRRRRSGRRREGASGTEAARRPAGPQVAQGKGGQAQVRPSEEIYGS